MHLQVALDSRTFSDNMEVHISCQPRPQGARLISYYTVDIACITLSTIKMIYPDLFLEEIPCCSILVKDHLS